MTCPGIVPLRIVTSSTGSSSRASGRVPAANRGVTGRRARIRGFTLLEILLVLALMGLLAGVLVGGASQLLNTTPKSPDEVFWAAVQEARKTALKSESETVMTYVDDPEKGKGFVITEGQSSKTFAIPTPGDLEVTFLSQQKGGNMIMVGGTVLETQKLPFVTFYPDGTCSPFRIQFYRNGATHTASIDPWTCAPMLSTSDSNNPGASS